MQKRNAGDSRRGGYALFVVIVIVLTISTLLAVMHSVGLQRAFMARKLSNRSRALAIAESGLARAYSVLANDFTARTNPAAFPPGTEGEGSYTVNVTPVSNDTAVVRVNGTVQGESVEVLVDVRRFKEGQDLYAAWDADPFNTLMFAGKSIRWHSQSGAGGETTVFNGRIHANQTLTIDSDNLSIAADITSATRVELKDECTIDGDVRAPVINTDAGCSITGTSTEDVVPYMSVPEIDLTPYYVEALRNGQIIDGNLRIGHAEVVSINPPGGILWVNGMVDIFGDGVINGCIISTGHIQIRGTVTQTRYGTYPALVSRDGKIDINGSGTYHGLVYAPNGDVTSRKTKKDLPGSGSFTGVIIAGKNLRVHGAWSLMFQEDSTPGYPDGTTPQLAAEVVYVSAWHR